ncbi:tyrosine-type recombinase/integrase [Methylobacterium oxalidis]|uniref:Integrase n=1 Tax=Methylobacterium oxalidis TaxID=944322 RepID=A0A512J3A7_9HYPH|nr:site-specific integrase [Methylobacterium oxalidis]GEP04445.1 integrase [Methylobacterium oxalidis]GJE34642.1 Prophage integrase IntS [Methylobacterium oxalidis]GLS62817.1 integrase [Methylobacterium oxalidis]
MRFTKAAIDSLTLAADKSEQYAWDDTLKGFGVKLNKGGSRNFLIQYRGQDGRTRRIVIGKVGTLTLDEARRRARELLVGAATGNDPYKEKKTARAQSAVTVGAVADAYLKHAEHRLKPRSFEQVERHLKQHWQPLAHLPVNGVTRANVAALLTAMASGGHRIKATRARSALSAMFSWAIGEGIAESNPVIGTNKPAEEKSRDRVLSETEVRAVWHACRDDAYSRIVQLLLLTGQRRDEVGSMVESELDLRSALWTIPAARTKNGLTHEVPLSRPALEILAGQPRIEGRDLVFGEGVGGFSGWSNSKERLDKRIAATGLVMPPWRLHDLRRTVATSIADRLKVQPHVVEAILNHISGSKAGVAGIYNRAIYRDEKREALERWAAHVLALTKPQPQPLTRRTSDLA